MKRGIIKMLLSIGIISLLCSVILAFTNVREYWLLISVFTALFCISIVFITIKNSVQQTVIELSSHKTFNKIISLVSYPIIFLSILKIPSDYFFITISIVFITIAINIFLQRRLVISHNGIRNVCRWSVKWENIKSYQLDREHGVLEIHTVNHDNYRQVSGLKENDFSVLIDRMNFFMNIKNTH